MIRTVFVLFLFAHGWIHAAMYALPVSQTNPPPFDPHRSWALRAAHVATTTTFTASVWLAWLATALLLLASVGLAVGASFWVTAAAAGAVVGLVLKIGWFHPWLSFGVALDIGLLAALTAAWPGSVY